MPTFDSSCSYVNSGTVPPAWTERIIGTGSGASGVHAVDVDAYVRLRRALCLKCFLWYFPEVVRSIRFQLMCTTMHASHKQGWGH